MGRDILSLIRPVETWCRANISLQSPRQEHFQRLLKMVQPPFEDGQFLTIEDFEKDVVTALNSVGVERSVVDVFRTKLREMKPRLNKRNRRMLVRKKDKAGGQMSKRRRLEWERTLTPTSATLVVVPDPLFEHWGMQIHRNLNLKTLSECGTTIAGVVVRVCCMWLLFFIGSHFSSSR